MSLTKWFGLSSDAAGEVNILSVDDLDRADVESVGNTVTLHELPHHLFPKLKRIVRTKPLVELVLKDCFNDPEKLCEILKDLQANTNIKTLSLDLRGNKHDMDCAREMHKLIGRKVLQSLYLPEGMDEICTAELLYEIKNTQSELKVLDISESVLNDDAVSYLEEILKNRYVRFQLLLKKCEGVSETTLSTKHFDKLAEAEKKGRRILDLKRKVRIEWFDHFPHVEIPLTDFDPREWQMSKVEENIPAFFKGKVRRTALRVVRLVARHRRQGHWQLVRTNRKRHADGDSRPAKVLKEEVDDLADMFQKQTVDQDILEENFSPSLTHALERPGVLPGMSSRFAQRSNPYDQRVQSPISPRQEDQFLHPELNHIGSRYLNTGPSNIMQTGVRPQTSIPYVPNVVIPTSLLPSSPFPPTDLQSDCNDVPIAENTAINQGKISNSTPTQPYTNETEGEKFSPSFPPSTTHKDDEKKSKRSGRFRNWTNRPDKELYKTPARRQTRQPVRYPEQESFNTVTNVGGRGCATTKNINCTFHIGKGSPGGDKKQTPKNSWRCKKKSN